MRMGRIFIFIFIIISIGKANQLDELINTALDNSPKLKVYQYLKNSKYQEKISAKALPNPILQFGLSNIPLNKLYPNVNEPMSSYFVGISQMFILPIKREKNSNIVENEILAIENKEEITKKEIIKNIKLKYYDWLYSFKKEKIYTEYMDKLENLLKLAEENYKFNKTPLSDIIKIKISKIEIQKKIENIRKEREVIAQDIYYLIGKKVDLRFEEADEDISNINFENLEKSVYIQEYKKNIEKLNAEIERKKVEYLPDIEFMVEYMFRPNRPDMINLKLGLTIPIWKSKKEDLIILQKEEEKNALYQQMKDVKLNILRQIEIIKTEYQKDLEILKLLNDEITEKENEIKAFNIAYKYKKADLSDILKSYLDLLEIKILEIDTKLKLKQYPIELEGLI